MFDELMAFFNYCANNDLENIRGDIVGRDTVELGTQTVTIDTCYAGDLELYESAVIAVREPEIYIIARYPDRESAVAGHADLLSKARADKSLTFFDLEDKIIRSIG